MSGSSIIMLLVQITPAAASADAGPVERSFASAFFVSRNADNSIEMLGSLVARADAGATQLSPDMVGRRWAPSLLPRGGLARAALKPAAGLVPALGGAKPPLSGPIQHRTELRPDRTRTELDPSWMDPILDGSHP